MNLPARLLLGSTSTAADAGYLAAADVAAIAAELGAEYRLVGGNAVTLLVAVHGVTDRVPGRETPDADFGTGYRVVADPRLLPALHQRSYTQIAGNRFVRTHTLPALATPERADEHGDIPLAARHRPGHSVLSQRHVVEPGAGRPCSGRGSGPVLGPRQAGHPSGR